MPIKWRQQLKLWLYIICICSIVRGVFFYLHIQAPLTLPSDTEESQTTFAFQVLPGSSFTQVTNQLEANGILNYSSDLRFYARLTGQANQIKAGEYVLETDINGIGLLDMLINGEVSYHQLVLLEGWTLAQALSAIQENETIVSSLEASSLQAELETTVYPEGLLFPDTYNFTRGTTDLAILLRAQTLMAEVLEEEWAGRDVGLPYENSYEALIMASIVEKETGLASEREQIAGVFIRRLQLGMRLQTDPTVIYGMGERFNGNLTRANLREDTEYNTYTNRGLPPTPIALAGRESIAASLHPDNGDSLYFVAKGDGSHYFSATLEEHNAAVRQYQLNNE